MFNNKFCILLRMPVVVPSGVFNKKRVFLAAKFVVHLMLGYSDNSNCSVCSHDKFDLLAILKNVRYLCLNLILT